MLIEKNMHCYYILPKASKSLGQQLGTAIRTRWYLCMSLENIFFWLWRQTQHMERYKDLPRKKVWKANSSTKGDSKVLQELRKGLVSLINSLKCFKTKTYSEPSQTPKMEPFVKSGNVN